MAAYCSAKLSAPTSFRLDGDTLTLHWNKVRQATGYSIEVNGITVTTRDNSYSLEGLEPGEYVVKIRAIDHGKEYADSDVAEYKFTREQESGLRYKLVGNSYTLVGIGSASGDVVMDDYYRGRPVTSISKAALRRCNRITSFVVGKNVTTIEDNAFYNCTELVSVTLPEGLVSVGQGVFQSCVKLETVELPSTLTELKDYAFSMCKSLKQINFNSGIQTIGKYAFSDCIALETLDLPESVVALSPYAFSGCEALRTLTMGNQLESIDAYAFYGCDALNSVQLGEGLVSIGEGAFQSCGLTSLVVPDSVKSIGAICFTDCTELADVTLGAGLTSIGQYAFNNTAVVNNCTEDVLIVGDWILGIMNPELSGNYIVPENIVGIADRAFNQCALVERVQLQNVRYIGAYSFAQCGSLWEVKATDALLQIGRYAFYQCAYLTDIHVGNSLERIADAAFYRCERLEDAGITLPASLQEIGSSAFKATRLYYASPSMIVYADDWVVGVKENVALSDAFIQEGTRGISNYAFNKVVFLDGVLFMPDSIEIIGRGAFYQNGYLVSTNFPKNLKYIGDYAFTSCMNVWFGDLGVTQIPEGCEYLGVHAFRDCLSLIGLYIPSTVKHIGESAFKDCVNLGMSSLPAGDTEAAGFVEGDIILCEGIESIGERAFYGCVGLQEIILPNSVQSIGTRCFYKCNGMKNVTFGSNLQEILPYTFYDCSALEEIHIPGNVKTIGKYAFRGCVAVTNITLGEGVEYVEDYAFVRCESVASLTIPDSLTYIGSFAFRGMNELKSIYLNENIEVIGKLAFYGPKNATIYYAGTQIPEAWADRWNATYIPMVMGAKLSEDNSYVVSWTATENGLVNVSQHNLLAAPTRNGYAFAGWSVTQGSQDWQYADLSEVPVGTTVYAIWGDYVSGEDIPDMPDNSENSEQTGN